jgi:hypothetical protein
MKIKRLWSLKVIQIKNEKEENKIKSRIHYVNLNKRKCLFNWLYA